MGRKRREPPKGRVGEKQGHHAQEARRENIPELSHKLHHTLWDEKDGGVGWIK